MMSPELRARWSAALREPHRVQGREALCWITPDGVRKQCCLDVLVELYQADHPEGTPGHLVVATTGEDDGTRRVSYRDPEGVFQESGLLPVAVALWADVHTSPVIGAYGAVTLNDSMGESFAQIADRIDDESASVR